MRDHCGMELATDLMDSAPAAWHGEEVELNWPIFRSVIPDIDHTSYASSMVESINSSILNPPSDISIFATDAASVHSCKPVTVARGAANLVEIKAKREPEAEPSLQPMLEMIDSALQILEREEAAAVSVSHNQQAEKPAPVVDIQKRSPASRKPIGGNTGTLNRTISRRPVPRRPVQIPVNTESELVHDLGTGKDVAAPAPIDTSKAEAAGGAAGRRLMLKASRQAFFHPKE